VRGESGERPERKKADASQNESEDAEKVGKKIENGFKRKKQND